MSAKMSVKLDIVWVVCGKCETSLKENSISQKDLDQFLKKHGKCCEDLAHLPRIVGYVRYPKEIKGRRVSVVLVPEPPKCKYHDCTNYKKDATTFCTNACASDDYDYRKMKRRKEEKQDKPKVRCKYKKCEHYSKKAADYCSKDCKKKSRKERRGSK